MADSKFSALPEKTTLADGDMFPIVDAVPGPNVSKRTLFSTIKTVLLAYLRNIIYPTGSYLEFAGVSAPSGFLACDGTSYLRATYADLFGVIGTTYGSVDGTHFNVPDRRGISSVGAGAHGTMTKAAGGAFDGGTIGATRNDQLQGHLHNTIMYQSTGGGVAAASAVVLNSVDIPSGPPITDGSNGTPRTGNETRPAQMAVLVCIKT